MPTLKNVHTPRQPHWSQDLAFKVTGVSPAKRMLRNRQQPMTEDNATRMEVTLDGRLSLWVNPFQEKKYMVVIS